MKKNIVVATDFSKRSFEVIHQAIAFAKSQNSIVHIVHIIENSFLAKLKDEDILYENSFEHIKKEIPSLEKRNFHCRQDSLKDGIEKYVKELKAYMVIIGSSGERNSVLREVLGTSTKSIVRSIDVPCLVLKSNRENFDFKNILIPTNLSKKSKIYIENTHKLYSNANIELIHSYSVPFEGRLNFYGMDRGESLSYQDSMRDFTNDEAFKFYNSLDIDRKKVTISIIKEGLNPDAFSVYADGRGCDLIAMHTTGLFSFFAFDLLEHSHKDILISKL